MKVFSYVFCKKNILNEKVDRIFFLRLISQLILQECWFIDYLKIIRDKASITKVNATAIKITPKNQKITFKISNADGIN
jgi:hypothetical protein